MSFLTEKGPYGYSRRHRLVEVVCIGALFAQVAILLRRLWHGTTTTMEALALVACVVVGYFAADLVSGLVHWAGDTLGSETMPFLGKNFVAPFRFHHVDPKAMARHDFIETNGNNCIISVGVLMPLMFLMPDQPGILFYGGAFLLFTILWEFGTNQFHKWAHSDEVSPLVRALQRSGLILSPEHHRLHHTPPHDTCYCITHGMLNPLLARIRFFRGLERLVAMVAPGCLFLEDRKKHAARAANGRS